MRFSAHLLEPQVQPLIGYPRAWSSSADGPVEADVVRAVIDSEDDFERYRGTLRGKIVLSQQARRVRPLAGDVVAVLAYSAAMDDRKMPRKSGAEH